MSSGEWRASSVTVGSEENRFEGYVRSITVNEDEGEADGDASHVGRPTASMGPRSLMGTALKEGVDEIGFKKPSRCRRRITGDPSAPTNLQILTDLLRSMAATLGMEKLARALRHVWTQLNSTSLNPKLAGVSYMNLFPPRTPIQCQGIRYIYDKTTKQKMEGSMWQFAAPRAILSLILDLLSLKVFINFRAVCRSWREDPYHRSNITSLTRMICGLYFMFSIQGTKTHVYFIRVVNQYVVRSSCPDCVDASAFSPSMIDFSSDR